MEPKGTWQHNVNSLRLRLLKLDEVADHANRLEAIFEAMTDGVVIY